MFVCCDESGIDGGSPWAVFGSLWIPDDSVLPEFEASAIALRQRTNCWGEMKWNNVDGRFIDPYLELLGLVLQIPDLRFACLSLDMSLLGREEMAVYHDEGGRNEAYMKFMSLLLKHRFRNRMVDGPHGFTVLYDEMNGPKAIRASFPQVVRRYFAWASQQDGSCDGHELIHLSRVDSQRLHAMQAVDLLAGATRQSLLGEGMGESRKGQARRRIVDRLEDWAGGQLTASERARKDERFNVWPWRP